LGIVDTSGIATRWKIQGLRWTHLTSAVTHLELFAGICMCVFTGFYTFSLDIALRILKLQLLPENCKLSNAMSISNLYRLEVLLTARSV
jgi:hypothetical protein